MTVGSGYSPGILRETETVQNLSSIDTLASKCTLTVLVRGRGEREKRYTNLLTTVENVVQTQHGVLHRIDTSTNCSSSRRSPAQAQDRDSQRTFVTAGRLDTDVHIQIDVPTRPQSRSRTLPVAPTCFVPVHNEIEITSASTIAAAQFI